jgi:hydrogenase maturation protein HypF
MIAFGAQLKSTVALTLAGGVALSQHLGDLGTKDARERFNRTIDDLSSLSDTRPRVAVCDLHPDYSSTQAAEASGLPMVKVQHHLAHVIAGMTEHGLTGPVLGVAWDGTGLGTDGTVWGGEFILVTEDGWHRVGHLRPFRLPGGEAAVREPRRSAFGVLFAAYGRQALAMTDLAPVAAFSERERETLAIMIERGVNAPVTTSAGRLFDAVAALLGLRQRSGYEGEAAALLEWRAKSGPTATVGSGYTFPLTTDNNRLIVDWGEALAEIVDDLRREVDVGAAARRFHRGLADAIAAVAQRVGVPHVVLTGGCFQNAFLSEAAIAALRGAGFKPHWHSSVPPNDGGIALGQAMWAARLIERGEIACA